MNDVSLIIFTCTGREHLLRSTIASFRKACKYSFSKTLLAIDGQINPLVIEFIQPDTIVQSFARKGYVHNIASALKQIDTECFFWLEDDWEFPVPVPVDDFIQQLDKPGVLQVILSKMDLDNSFERYDGNYFIPAEGFSANPGFCKTGPIRTGFDNIALLKKDNTTQFVGFEMFLNNYAVSKGLVTLRYFLDDKSTVHHNGELESTAREYHMVNSIDAHMSLINKEYISGLGSDKKISLKNKVGIFFKLWVAAAALSIKLWSSREAYDFAFRIYAASLRKFKH